jgi:hypothetical protein
MENITSDQALRITEKVLEKFGDAIGGNPQLLERIMFGVIDSACENDDNDDGEVFRGLDPAIAVRVARMIVEYRDDCEINLNTLGWRSWTVMLCESDED